MEEEKTFKSIKLPSTLFDVQPTTTTSRLRHDLTDLSRFGLNSRGFIVHDVLTREECAQFIDGAERINFENLENIFPSNYRSNDRVVILDSDCARALYARLLPSLRPSDTLEEAMGGGGRGVWIPYGVNECIKFGRYYPSCYFAPHIDGPWVPDKEECSIYTVVIYLNDDTFPAHATFTGGNTNFFLPPQGETEGEGEMSRIERSQQTFTQVCTVKPRAGSALIFKHETWHEAASLLSGVKYILRTELLFRRVPSALQPMRAQDLEAAKKEEEAMAKIDALYQRSERQLREKDRHGFVESYLEALDEQAAASAALAPNSDAMFGLLHSSDIVVQILAYLSGRDLYSALGVNSSWYKLGRSGVIWQRIYNAHVHDASSAAPINNTSWLQHNWYHMCRQLITMDTRSLDNNLLLSKINTAEKPQSRMIQGAVTDSIYLGDVAFTPLLDDWDRIYEEGPPLVVDIGSYTTRMACLQDAEPPPAARTIIARRSYRHCHSMSVGMGMKDFYVGPEALEQEGQSRIYMEHLMHRGLVTNWDHWERMLHYAYYNGLHRCPDEHICVLTCSPLFPEAMVERMTLVAVESFNTHLLALVPRPLAALHAIGRKTGVVLHSGGGITYCVPIYEGSIIVGAVKSLELGGEHVRETLQQTLKEGPHESLITEELNDVTFRKFAQRAVLKHAYVAKNFESELAMAEHMAKRNWVAPNYRDVGYMTTLPAELAERIDGIVQAHNIKRTVKLFDQAEDPPYSPEIDLTDVRFTCAEIMFRPSLAKHAPKTGYMASKEQPPTEPQVGVHELVRQAIDACDPDLRAVLYGNIVLSGGNTLLPGFAERLEIELNKIVQHHQLPVRVDITARPDRDQLVFNGVVALAKDSRWLKSHVISRDDYDTQGPVLGVSVFKATSLN